MKINILLLIANSVLKTIINFRIPVFLSRRRQFFLTFFYLFLVSFFYSCSSTSSEQNQNNKSYKKVITLAGIGIAGSIDGSSAQASFWGPEDIVTDLSGNVYVLERSTSRIRKIDASGTVSTFAGDKSGDVDGVGVQARFLAPEGIAIDKLGNLYVADTGNHKIRKISTAGVVTTIAGGLPSGSVDGNSNIASFSSPRDLAIDDSGNLFVVDAGNNKIRKISPTGVVSTFVGNGVKDSVDGKGLMASLNSPKGICFDILGNLYVTEWGSDKIRKITPDGLVSTFAGGGKLNNLDGIGTNSGFNLPSGITVDAIGNLYVADAGNHNIRKITTSGVVTTFSGIGVSGEKNGLLSEASFNSPFGIAIDTFGNIFIADTYNQKIRKISFE